MRAHVAAAMLLALVPVLLTPRIGSVRNDFSRCNWRELPELRAPNRFSGLVELANTGFDTARARPLTALWFGCGRGRAVLHSRVIQLYAETQGGEDKVHRKAATAR